LSNRSFILRQKLHKGIGRIFRLGIVFISFVHILWSFLKGRKGHSEATQETIRVRGIGSAE